MPLLTDLHAFMVQVRYLYSASNLIRTVTVRPSPS
jgi:hypothetical protein